MNNFVTAEEFDFSMKKLGIAEMRPEIAVAVSGGGDSLALVVLMQEWVRGRGGEFLALTVDHGLRPDSSGEAQKVHEIFHDRGIAHEVLVWHGEKPATHIQELARDARYRLLLQACRQRGFPVLAIAHNLEDQIETFWMRLAHGSGLDGLSAMASVRKIEGVSIIRPVLAFSREQLRATCTHHNISWIEDPSNQNEKYLRVKLRQFEEVLAGEGLTPARLAQTVQKLEDARQALQVMAERAVASCVTLHQEGYATLKTASWKDFPRDIQRRIIWQALMMVAVQPYPAGFEVMEQTRLDLQNPAFAGKSLAGCEIFPGRSGDMLVVREANAVEGHVRIEEGKIWDGRFIVSGFHGESLEAGALGDAGLAELRKNIGSSPISLQKLDALHFKVKRVLPALWQAGNLLAVPHVSYYSHDCPRGLKSGRMDFCSFHQPSVKIV